MEMPTGYDLLEHSQEFRMHMLRRLAAGLTDVIIVFIPVISTLYYFDAEPKALLAGVISGFVWFIYSVIIESRTGTSIGKKMMGLVVVSGEEPMTLSKGIIRNVPKMFWYIFLPLDVFVGLANVQDPRKRWVDTISNTSVIKKRNN